MIESDANFINKIRCCKTWWRHEMVNSPHKGQWRRAIMFSLTCVWINGWVNNREAGDWRRHRAHYDVIVVTLLEFRKGICEFKSTTIYYILECSFCDTLKWFVFLLTYGSLTEITSESTTLEYWQLEKVSLLLTYGSLQERTTPESITLEYWQL